MVLIDFRGILFIPITFIPVARDVGSVLGLGRSFRGRHGNPLQYSCLENPIDGGAWWATVPRSQRVRHD